MERRLCRQAVSRFPYSIVKQRDHVCLPPADMHHRPGCLSGLGKAGLLSPSLPERACGTTGRFTAPAAPCTGAHGPVCFRHTVKNSASEAAQRPRSAREWTLRLAACPRGVTYADVTPFGRAVARTCTWTVRPCCRRLSPPAPFKGSTDPQAC